MTLDQYHAERADLLRRLERADGCQPCTDALGAELEALDEGWESLTPRPCLDPGKIGFIAVA